MPTSPRLSRRLKPKNAAPLVTLDDALAYMVALPDEIVHHKAWQRAVVLTLDTRMSPSRDRMMALTYEIEHALVRTGRLDL